MTNMTQINKTIKRISEEKTGQENMFGFTMKKPLKFKKEDEIRSHEI